jgi:hypothetical protein
MSAPPVRPWHRPTLADRLAEGHQRAASYTCPTCGGETRVIARTGDAEPIVIVNHSPPCPRRQGASR